jgi:hypothetical protein
MRRLVINVDERPLHIRKDLDLVLQLLTEIVRLDQRRVRLHHDVHFYEIVLSRGASVIVRHDSACAHSVNEDIPVHSAQKHTNIPKFNTRK